MNGQHYLEGQWAHNNIRIFTCGLEQKVALQKSVASWRAKQVTFNVIAAFTPTNCFYPIIEYSVTSAAIFVIFLKKSVVIPFIELKMGGG